MTHHMIDYRNCDQRETSLVLYKIIENSESVLYPRSPEMGHISQKRAMI